MFPTDLMTMNLRTACCMAFGWPTEEFEKRALRKTFPLPLAPLVAAMWRLKPEVFRADLNILREFGAIENRGQFRANAHEIARCYSELRAFNFWRRRFKARISGRLLIRLGNRAWNGPQQAGTP